MKKGLLIIFLFCATAVFSQTNYLVYQLSGNVSQTIGKERKPLRIGQVLKDDGILWLEKKASVTLVCENYTAFFVNTAGKYELKKHQELCPKENYSITADYFRFIWEELTHPHETPEDNRRKYMNNKGAVVRGCPGVSIDHIFDSINSYGSEIFISWETDLSKERLSFTLCSDEKDGEQIFSMPVKEKYISLDSIKKHARGFENIYWGIAVDGNEVCPRKYIRLWSEGSYNLFLDSLKKQLPLAPGSAEWYYMTGFLLETNFFIKEALDFYKQAALLDPTSKRYKRTAIFLTKRLGKS